MALNVLLLVVGFLGIWFSSGMVLMGVEKLSSRLHLSRFVISVVLLGAVSSLPEFGVLVNSLLLKTPDVSMGNLVGGQMYILFLILPTLAILTGKVKLPKALQSKSLIVTLLVLGAPLIVLLDKEINTLEAGILIGLYLFFVAVYWREMSVLEKVEKHIPRANVKNFALLVKIIGGMVLILVASNIVVTQIHEVSLLLQFDEFFISMILTAVGTNVPELSMMIRGIIAKRNDIALGGYIGSAALNSFLMGILVLSGGAVAIEMNLSILLILISGIGAFWYFARSKQSISRREALILILFYFIFIGFGIGQARAF